MSASDRHSALAELNAGLESLQKSARRTLPIFTLGILSTIIAAGVALYYIVTLSADLREARAALQNSQDALLEARSNLAAANSSLRQAQAATRSPSDSRKIQTAIASVSRSQASISTASNSISSAEAKLSPADTVPGKESTAPVRRTRMLQKPVAYDQRFEVADTGDGFLSLRSQPSMASAELARIPDGDALQCGDASPNSSGNLWRACRDSEGHEGFVSNKFIRPR